jgi:hypothetical protein
VHPFFHKNLSSGTYIVLKEVNQDPELLKSFYQISTEGFSLLMDLIRSYIIKINIQIFIVLPAE